ncbi:MAG: hypothetical protein PHW82_15885 [Bacteroidales bacterium]|nr:hypothetical protein [Bacteroidales bacterium]
MKKTVSLILISIIIIFISSCGGPKADVKKMLKMYEEYTEVAVKAAVDKVIDENETKELNAIKSNIEKFGEEMDSKYEDNEEATKEFEKYMSIDKNKEIVKKYTKALMSLWSCEGAENLK